MSEWEAIGMVVTVLVILSGLFITMHRPINENTKAMTTLTIEVKQLKETLGEQQDSLDSYKRHVSVSQQKQWDVINEHSDILVKHGMEIEQIKKNMTGA